AIGSIRLGSLFLTFPTSRKGRPGLDPFRLGVDVGEADVQILGPVGNKAPAQQVQTALSGLSVVTDHRKLVGRRHIPARRKIWSRPMRRDGEHKLDLADIGGKTDAATHGSNLSLARWTTQETGHDRTRVRTFKGRHQAGPSASC